jgi:hypothetical protein
MFHNYCLVKTGVLCLSLVLCTTASATVVINEIDYDQPSTDAAEFIELKNVGTAPVNLGTYLVVLINGNGDTIYETFNLPAVDLAPGDYFVICANPATTPECDLDVSPDTNLIQNGPPDAVALYDGDIQLDAVSYEGDVPGYVETAGAVGDIMGEDFQGISRFPDGADTNDNSVDFTARCVTPGEANAEQSISCFDPVPATLYHWGFLKAMYR